MRHVFWTAFAIGRHLRRLRSWAARSGQAMSDPKSDCEALIGSVLPFAEQMLTTHGAFIPFGGAMRADGQIVSIAGYDENEQSQPTNVIALMKDKFVEAARRGEYKATAIVSDVKVELPSTEENSDAIAVSLNHRDNYSVVVLFPYKIDAGELILGTVFAQE